MGSASDGVVSGLKWVVTASEGVMSDSENIVRVSKGGFRPKKE